MPTLPSQVLSLALPSSPPSGGKDWNEQEGLLLVSVFDERLDWVEGLAAAPRAAALAESLSSVGLPQAEQQSRHTRWSLKETNFRGCLGKPRAFLGAIALPWKSLSRLQATFQSHQTHPIDSLLLAQERGAGVPVAASESEEIKRIKGTGSSAGGLGAGLSLGDGVLTLLNGSFRVPLPPGLPGYVRPRTASGAFREMCVFLKLEVQGLPTQKQPPRVPRSLSPLSPEEILVRTQGSPDAPAQLPIFLGESKELLRKESLWRSRAARRGLWIPSSAVGEAFFSLHGIRAVFLRSPACRLKPERKFACRLGSFSSQDWT